MGECLVISENETRKEFLNVNANKANGPDGLTGKIKKKTCASLPLSLSLSLLF